MIIHDYVGREIWYDWAVHQFSHNIQPKGTVLAHMSNSEIFDNGDENEIQPTDNPASS